MCDDLRKAVALAARCRKSMRNQGSAAPRAVEKLQSVARRLPFLPVLLTAELCEVDRAAGQEKTTKTTLAELDSAEAALCGTLEAEGTKLLSVLEQALQGLSARWGERLETPGPRLQSKPSMALGGRPASALAV